jgi:hypothetical protein
MGCSAAPTRYVKFNVHSFWKHHALADEARFHVLSPEVSAELKARLEKSAADAPCCTRLAMPT